MAKILLFGKELSVGQMVRFVCERVENIKGKNAGYKYCFLFLNSILNDNFLDWTKFKGFADDKLNVC